MSSMNIFDKIEALALKKKAMESVLSDNANTELIAERVVLLLDGDVNLLDFIISGVPYELKDPSSRLGLEKYLRDRQHVRLEHVDEVIVKPSEVHVDYHYTSRVWLKPDNIEGMKRIQSGSPTYNEDTKYSESSDYSMACDYSSTGSTDIPLSNLLKFGIEFKRL